MADVKGQKEIMLSGRKPRGRLNGDHDGSEANRVISHQLKAMYREIEEEGIPDQFLDLLEKLDEAEKSQSDEVDE